MRVRSGDRIGYAHRMDSRPRVTIPLGAWAGLTFVGLYLAAIAAIVVFR